jgi:hypothetical protein
MSETKSLKFFSDLNQKIFIHTVNSKVSGVMGGERSWITQNHGKRKAVKTWNKMYLM